MHLNYSCSLRNVLVCLSALPPDGGQSQEGQGCQTPQEEVQPGAFWEPTDEGEAECSLHVCQPLAPWYCPLMTYLAASQINSLRS